MATSKDDTSAYRTTVVEGVDFLVVSQEFLLRTIYSALCCHLGRKLRQAFTVECFDCFVLLMPLLAPAAACCRSKFFKEISFDEINRNKYPQFARPWRHRSTWGARESNRGPLTPATGNLRSAQLEGAKALPNWRAPKRLQHQNLRILICPSLIENFKKSKSPRLLPGHSYTCTSLSLPRTIR